MRHLLLALLVASVPALLSAAPASAGYGVEGFDVAFTGPPAVLDHADAPPGPVVNRAGAHPFAMSTSFTIKGHPSGEGGIFLDEQPRDFLATQIIGFAGNPGAVPTCSTVDFLTPATPLRPNCPDSAALGYLETTLASKLSSAPAYNPAYNLTPAPGEASRIGFWVEGIPVSFGVTLQEEAPYRIVAGPTNISQLIEVVGARLTLWGVPADPRHDLLRGSCLFPRGESTGACPAKVAPKPFITLPRACDGPLASDYASDSWEHSGARLPDGRPDLTDPNWLTGSALTHDGSGNPQGMSGCGALPFGPEITAQPGSAAASSPTGLDFSLEVPDEGLLNPAEDATAGADIAKTVVTLPEGMTVNPSQAEGLEVCTEARLAQETSQSGPGEGCPQAAKIGTIEVETPLLEGKLLKGALYVAEPYHNLAGNSLIAVYVVIKSPELGILVRQPLRVSPDPRTGRLVTTAEDMPQLPFSHFRLHFREGGRAPLITPPGCGAFTTEAVLYPSSGGAPVTSTSAFKIISGPDNSPCPSGTAPFAPGFEAGTESNAAGRYSPFYMRISRNDGEQDLTKLSQVLPPGVLGNLSGVPYCPEAGIARALGRTGEHGGEAELANPSCPAASQIGRTVAGAGAGSQLTYVPGRLYLAGPYHGDPLSVVSITPAVAGPFDAGAVVVRFALNLDPVSGEVELDGKASDPIPHILQGIPLNVRDLRAYVDRPQFTLNATSCEKERVRATLFGGGTVLFPLPDHPVERSDRYQAAGCAALGFKPRLEIALSGATGRGAHPALRAVVRPRPGDANFSRAVVTLPHSAFLEQAHIRTICTRVQFAAGPGNGADCPRGSVYGHARALSPLLDQPLSGPVFLRSSSHNLPDLVVALHGIVNIDLAARIDSIHGGIRSTFSAIPDAPVSRFVLDMQGAKQGLIVNSRNLCFKASRNRSDAMLEGHNGKAFHARPAVKATRCG
jgi:hypothetical protein